MKSLDFFYLLYYLCIFFFNFSFCFFSCLFFPRCVITASCYTQSFTGSFNCISFLFQFFHRFYLSPQDLFRFFNISIWMTSSRLSSAVSLFSSCPASVDLLLFKALVPHLWTYPAICSTNLEYFPFSTDFCPSLCPLRPSNTMATFSSAVHFLCFTLFPPS